MSIRDITESRSAQLEVEHAANFLRFNPNPVLELSASGEINYFNDAAETMARELGLENIAQMLPPDTAAIVRECLRSDTSKLRVETQIGPRVISWSFFPVKFTNTVHCYGGDVTARKQTEDALKLLHAALEVAANAIVITDQSGDILWVNAAFTSLTGYTRQEVLGKNPRILKSGKQDEADYRNLWQTISSGQVWRGELTNRRKDGSLYIEEMTVTPVRSADGTIGRYIAIKQDVSERKRSEAELAGARRLAKYGNWSWDVTDDLITWSDELYQIFGVEKAKFVHSLASFIEMVEPADRQAVLETNRRVRENGSFFEIVYRILTPQGENRVVREMGYGVRNEAGKVVRLVGTAQDITAQNRAEGELRWKTAFLEAQVNSSLDGILVVNSQGKHILLNQRMVQLWKMPPDIASEIDDRKQVQFVMGKVKNPQAFVEKVDYLYAHPNEISRDEIELADGTVLDRYSSPVVGKDGTHYGRIWAFRDITDQRRLEAQTRQAQRMEAIGQLASGVAHDFNNLLAVMRGNADLLLMNAGEHSSHTRESLEQVVTAVERAAILTRQLLVFSRKQVMQFQPLILNDLVRNLTKMLTRVIREDIGLECRYAEQLPYVKADPGMMEQVLLNLVVNARDAMPRGGQLLISTESVLLGEARAQVNPEARSGEFVCLSVTDTGTGIAPEHLPQIFEPFFTTKEPGKGTGLGLATVYGILKQHRGWVEVSSGVGMGTTFKLFVPAIAPPANVSATPQVEAGLRGGSETILLVEDDGAVRAIMRQVLETYQYKVHEATCAREAREVWRQRAGEIDLLLTDIVMPEGVSGRDLAEQLRAERPKLKVVLMSAYGEEVMMADTEFLRRSRSHFLQKPSSTGVLVRTVRECLDEK